MQNGTEIRGEMEKAKRKNERKKNTCSQLTVEWSNRSASAATIHARFRIGGPLDRRTGLAATRAVAFKKPTRELGC